MKKNLIVLALALSSSVANAEAPEGIQQIATHLDTYNAQAKSCAFWANEASAAVMQREKGIKEQDAERAVPFPRNPTDDDAAFHASRIDVINQVYEDDDLQGMNPKQIHDAVFKFCKSLGQ
jgi:hypothetical protein